MKKVRKILSLFLCLALIVGMMPCREITVCAAESISAGMMFNSVNIENTSIGCGESTTFSVGELNDESLKRFISYNWNVVVDGKDLVDSPDCDTLFGGYKTKQLTVKANKGNIVLNGAVISLTVTYLEESVTFSETATLMVSHTESDWIVDKEATEEEAGSHHKECTECGEILETGEIETLPCTHTILRSNWSYDETKHFRSCLCGAAAKEVGLHTAGDWAVRKEATEEEDGIRYRACTTCKHTLEEETVKYEESVIDSMAFAGAEFPEIDDVCPAYSDTIEAITCAGRYNVTHVCYLKYNNEDREWKVVNEGEKFIRNATYRLEFEVEAQPGYSFDPDMETVTMNGQSACFELYVNEETGKINSADVYVSIDLECEHSFTEKIKDEAHLVEGSGSNCASPCKYYFDCAYCDVISEDEVWTSENYGPHDIDTNHCCTICEKQIYDVWVSGVQITEENADDVLGDATVSYNPETKVMKLDGYNNGGDIYELPDLDNYGAAIFSKEDLKLEISRNNNIYSNLYGIICYGSLAISGDGGLYIKTKSTGIEAGVMEMISGALNIQNKEMEGICADDVTIRGGDTVIYSDTICVSLWEKNSSFKMMGGNLEMYTEGTDGVIIDLDVGENIPPDLSEYKGYYALIGVLTSSDELVMDLYTPDKWEEYKDKHINGFIFVQIPEEYLISSVQIDNFKIPKVGETINDVSNTAESLLYGGKYELSNIEWYVRDEEGDFLEAINPDEPIKNDTEYVAKLSIACEWGFPIDFSKECVTINGEKVAEIDLCATEDIFTIDTMEIYYVFKQHVHTYGEDWCMNETNHWKECSCGERLEVAEHAYDEGTITTAATETETGVKTYTCSRCSYKKTEVIPKLEKKEDVSGNTTPPEEDFNNPTPPEEDSKNPTPPEEDSKKPTPPEANSKNPTSQGTDSKNPVSQNQGVQSSVVNSVLTDSKTGNKYKVTKQGSNGGTVEFVSPKNKKIKKLTIPATVKISGITYKVTSVGKNAFKGCTKLTSVTIGKNVSKIGTKAFYGCKKLKNITIKTTKLKSSTVGKNAFKGTPKSAKVKVPKKSLKAYKKFLYKKGIQKKATIKKL